MIFLEGAARYSHGLFFFNFAKITTCFMKGIIDWC